VDSLSLDHVSNCLGWVGQKNEKFCTKRKQGTNELDTCGTVSHAKKAITAIDHIYCWDGLKEQGYLEPLLSVTFTLAELLYALRGEALSRVQFNELVGASCQESGSHDAGRIF
jgi:hypothetical protein